jgi:hypothetical protein
VDVLEELKATVTVWRLEHRNVGVVAIKADGSVGPLTTDRVTADDRETEVCEKRDRCFEVANGDADVLKFDGHELHASEPGRLAPVASRGSIEQASAVDGGVLVVSGRESSPLLDVAAHRRPSSAANTSNVSSSSRLPYLAGILQLVADHRDRSAREPDEHLVQRPHQ